MKRPILIAAAAAALTAIVVLCIVLGGRNRTVLQGGEEGAYPYTLNVKGNKLKLTVNGETPEGYSWKPQTSLLDTVELGTPEVSKGKTVLTATAKQDGAETLVLVLKKDGALPDILYKIDLSLQTEDNALRVQHHSFAPVESAVRGGEESGYPYSLNYDSRGKLYLGLTVKDGESWQYDQLAQGLTVVDVVEKPGSDARQVFLIGGYGADESCDISFTNEAAGFTLKLHLRFSAQGAMSVEQSEMEEVSAES